MTQVGRRSWGSNAILNDLLSLLAVGKWKFWIVVVVVPWDAWIHSWWVIPMIRVLLRAKNHYHYQKMHVTSTLIFYSTNYDSKWKQASLSEAENGYTHHPIEYISTELPISRITTRLFIASSYTVVSSIEIENHPLCELVVLIVWRVVINYTLDLTR